jgi:hypothetical protein
VNEQLSSRERSDLLAYALFDVDKRVGGFRQSLLTFLVSVALFELDHPATRQEILSACRKRFLPNDGVVLNQIETVVSVARNAGLLLDAEDGKVKLSADRQKHLSEAAERIRSLRVAFHREMADAVENKLGEPLSDEMATELQAVLEGFVQRLFQEESVALAKAFGKEGQGLDAAVTHQVGLESLEGLARSLADRSEKLRRAKIASGIRSGLLGLGGPGQRYLATVYQKTVAFALLQQDPTVRRVRRELAARRVFYLDANVVMALMFSAHEKHEQVRAAVEAARDVGAALVVSPVTVGELELQIEGSDARYSELNVPEVNFSILNDVILRSFAAELEQNPEVVWHTFLAGYLPLEEALEEAGISVITEDVPDARHDERWARVHRAVKKSKPPYTHEKVIDADTLNIILVQIRRRKLRADAMGRRVWLITLDHHLKYAERDLIRDGSYEVPASKRVRTWAGGLSPHLSPDDEDLGDYVLRVVQSELGLLAEDPIFADVDFLSILEQGPFNLGDLLAAEPDKTRRVLVALQEDHELKEVLEDEPNEPKERDAWVERLSETIRDALSKLDEAALKSEAMAAVESERDRALAEIEAMQRNRESKPIWRRALKVFRR